MYSNDGDNEFINDDQISLLIYLSDQAMPADLNAEDRAIIEMLADDTNHSNDLADSQPADIPNGIDDLEEAESQLLNINFFDSIDLLAVLPRNNTVQNNSTPLPKENSNKSFIVKSSNPINTASFTTGDRVIYTGKLLRLTIPPFDYQRARYEGELEEVLRYIFVPNNASLTLTMSDLRSNIAPDMSFLLRITRTTIPYGTDKLVFPHPYPIWLNDKDGKVYNGSLFIPATGETIKIDYLIMQRLKQNMLGKIKRFSIFTSDQLDFNDFHSINTSKGKNTIKKYQLQYSILHFQIFLVDRDNKIYPTDMKCQTGPIYEYEGKELDNLPPHVRQSQKQLVKRKQIGQLKKSSIAASKKKLPKKSLVADVLLSAA